MLSYFYEKNKRKYYIRISNCWKRKDDLIEKKTKIIKEVKLICSENQDLTELEVINIIIADFKGQISNNNFIQMVSMAFSVLLILFGSNVVGFPLVYSTFIVAFIVILVTLYCLRYLYAEGFVTQIL